MSNQQTIYKVTTEGDCEGKSVRTLGYATGSSTDIKNYYKDKQTYDIYLDPIVVVNITPGMATEKQQLVRQKEQLKSQLDSIENKLKNY